jgi:thymidine kinase
MHCGDLATHSYRTVDSDSIILLGEKESYIPLCRGCYVIAGKKVQLQGKA